MPEDKKLPLTEKFLANLAKKDNGTTVDKYHDNLGVDLYIHVSIGNALLWKQRLRIKGANRRIERGLGRYPRVSLVEARRIAFENHEAARKGRDVVEERRAEAEEIAAASMEVGLTLEEHNVLSAEIPLPEGSEYEGLGIEGEFGAWATEAEHDREREDELGLGL